MLGNKFSMKKGGYNSLTSVQLICIQHNYMQCRYEYVAEKNEKSFS